MSMTNAQAALMASASLQGHRGVGATVLGDAERFKAWLDAIDAKTLRDRQQAGGAWGTGAVPLP